MRNTNSLSLDLTRRQLHQLQQAPVRAGLIGCGAFGTSILAQAASVPLLEISAVADHDLAAAYQAYHYAGIPDAAILLCDSRRDALRALEAGQRVIVADPLLLLELPLEVMIEATGQPEGGARHAEAAIRHGRHVAMVTKEADVAVGPILKHLADEAGVVYTAVDGDQHGLLISLVAWARQLGLEVLCGGKSRDIEIGCDHIASTLSVGSYNIPLTAEEIEVFELLPWEPGARDHARQDQYLGVRRARLEEWSRPGGWDLAELVIVANATGLSFDLPSGIHCPVLYAGEIPRVLCPKEMGGILCGRGVIDAVNCLCHPHDAGLGGGVFVVVTAENARAREVLCRGAVCHNEDQTAALITRPYHLLGIEAIHSILAAALLGVCTGARDYQPRFDVLIRAARDLEAGTRLGDDHSPEIEAFLGPAAPLADDQPLPAHLAHGNRLSRSVARGSVITRDMVIPPADSRLWALRARQDSLFLSSSGPQNSS